MASSALVDLFGDSLLAKEGSTSTTAALASCDAVGIYFSAHWCPPCRGFTPKLAEIYKAYKAKGLSFEIVFVSSDKSEQEFGDYYAEMPWLALPFADRDRKSALSKKYKVNGIPTLVIVGKDGSTITTDGREAVMEDPEGAQFPWTPPTLWEALGEEVLAPSGGSVAVSSLRGPGKFIGLYFSAHWCPPCRGFTPKLVETLKAVKAAGKPLELIFVSSDKDAAQFAEYFGTMTNFHAVPHGDPRKEKLSKRFGVQGIPSLVILDADSGATVNGNARGAVGEDPTGETFPWAPPAVASLSAPEGINENASLCVLLDGCSEAVRAAAMDALTPIATKAKAAGDEMLFFAAKSSEGAVPQVRQLTKLAEVSTQPQLLLLDIPDDGGYYFAPPADLTADTVADFLAAYKNKSLERKQLG